MLFYLVAVLVDNPWRPCAVPQLIQITRGNMQIRNGLMEYNLIFGKWTDVLLTWQGRTKRGYTLIVSADEIKLSKKWKSVNIDGKWCDSSAKGFAGGWSGQLSGMIRTNLPGRRLVHFKEPGQIGFVARKSEDKWIDSRSVHQFPAEALRIIRVDGALIEKSAPFIAPISELTKAATSRTVYRPLLSTDTAPMFDSADQSHPCPIWIGQSLPFQPFRTFMWVTWLKGISKFKLF